MAPSGAGKTYFIKIKKKHWIDGDVYGKQPTHTQRGMVAGATRCDR